MSGRKNVLTEERAREIAEDFMSQVNPYDWHGVEARKGKGDDRPEGFGEKTISYDTDFEWGDKLDITCEYDDDERRWVHHCELRDSDGDDILYDQYSWHIDDFEELVETIMDVCE